MSIKTGSIRLSDVYYPSKKDLWLTIILLSASIIFLVIPFILYSEPIHPLLKVGTTIFFLFMSVIILLIYLRTGYLLTDNELIICCLSKRHPISLTDIYEVFPTRNPLSAPALSLDRLRIKFNGNWFGTLISPDDKEKFIHDLLFRCPQLVQKNKKLILKDSIV